MTRAPFAIALLLVPGCVVFEPPSTGQRDAAGNDAAVPSDAAREDAHVVPVDAGFDAAVVPEDDAGIDAAIPPHDAGRVDAGIVRRPTLTACAFGAPITMGVITDPSLDEVSGTAASRRHPHVLWMLEDSGSAAVVHAVNDEGRLLGTYRVAGSAIDYEDIAIGPGPTPGIDYLYVGDIGDNDGSRTSIVVYRAPEPDVSFDQVRETGMLTGVEPLPMTFPDGYRDNAEALFVDPTTEDVYLVSKNGFSHPNNLFRLAAPHTAAVARTLELLGPTYAGDGTDIAVTSADIAADGSRIVIRGLRAVNVWTRRTGASIADTILTTLPCAGPVADELKGESIALSPTGYFTISEGTSVPISFVPFVP